MTVLLTMFLSAASFLLVLAVSPGRAADGISPTTNNKIVLTPEERATVLRGKIVLRTVPSPGQKGRTYEAIGLIQGTLEEAVSVLTDFERYPEYMPNVSASRVCERVEPCSVIETTLHLPLGVKKQYRLRYTGSREEDGFRLSWEMMPWPELKPSLTIADTSGFWFVRDFEEGGLIVVYRVFTDPGHVPLGLKGIAQGVAKHKIPDGIVKLRERVRSVFRPVAK
jgi:hypothetical protein